MASSVFRLETPWVSHFSFFFLPVFTGLYLVLLGFVVVLACLRGFSVDFLSRPKFFGSKRLRFSTFGPELPILTGFYRVLLGFDLAILSFTGF